MLESPVANKKLEPGEQTKEPEDKVEGGPIIKRNRLDWQSPFAICTVTEIHLLQIFFLSFFFTLQSVLINYYIWNHFRLYTLLCAFGITDVICFVLFTHSLFCSHKYMIAYTKYLYEERMRQNIKTKSLNERIATISKLNEITAFLELERFNPVQALQNKASVMPFIYISWIIYVCVLSAKITVMFKSSMPDVLSKKNLFGPQTLQMVIGLSSLVFLFLVEGHNWEHMEHPRNRYAKSLAAQTVIDIFDSVSLLAIILHTPNREQLVILENLIVVLSNINLLLPAMRLYKLSLAEMVATKMDQIFLLVHAILYALLINGCFFVIRLVVWFYAEEDPSIYLMKNVLSIILSMWQVYPAYMLLKHKEITETD